MELTVTGMSCGGCEQNVEDAVSALSGVTAVEADHESDSLVIEGSVSADDARAAVEDAGYEPA
jgi:copper chaperone